MAIAFSYNRIVSHRQVTQKLAFADYKYVYKIQTTIENLINSTESH